MPGARWFTGATINYAENALRSREGLAIVARSESRPEITLTYAELREEVRRVSAGLSALGVAPGDRVAGYMPNIPEAVIALLATASLGAIWSSCPPEFGPTGVVDRLSQIQPKVIIAADGYVYAGKTHSRAEALNSILEQLPSVDSVVLVSVLEHKFDATPRATLVGWEDLRAENQPLTFLPVAFEHPLWILYSSGTTGLPKPIVHGHGGIVLEHLKSLYLHRDISHRDRFLWLTTTGWMMWNYLVGGLLVGATIVLYDGSIGPQNLMSLWDLTAALDVTFLGAGAGYFEACLKQGLVPGNKHDLSHLRGLGVTGSPLSGECFEWVYQAVSRDILLGPASGGTDVCSSFVGSCPTLPVVKGEMQCCMLGVKVEAFDEAGRAVIDQVGELVVTEPMPSMPLFLWGDDSGTRLTESYFSTFPGVWRHGDWIQITDRGSALVLGRSDATLNRGGVRMGTAEFYGVVDAIPGVSDSLVVEAPLADKGNAIWLFLVLEAGIVLDDALLREVADRIRGELSPRHVPDAIRQAPGIPRTTSGKKMEIPVRRVLEGVSIGEVASAGLVANPEVFAYYAEVAQESAPTGDRPPSKQAGGQGGNN
jgi:acetoacetyl-CoA synthetase